MNKNSTSNHTTAEWEVVKTKYFGKVCTAHQASGDRRADSFLVSVHRPPYSTIVLTADHHKSHPPQAVVAPPAPPSVCHSLLR